jgi:hypothetical protein
VWPTQKAWRIVVALVGTAGRRGGAPLVINIETEPRPFLHGDIDDALAQYGGIGSGSTAAFNDAHAAGLAGNALGRWGYRQLARPKAGEAGVLHQALAFSLRAGKRAQQCQQQSRLA